MLSHITEDHMRRLLLFLVVLTTPSCTGSGDAANASSRESSAASSAHRAEAGCSSGYRPIRATDWRRGNSIYVGPGEIYGTIVDLKNSHTFGDGSRGMAVGIGFSDGTRTYFPPMSLTNLGYLVAC
jgi:hypothetical protein